jgi:hypothetical protein
MHEDFPELPDFLNRKSNGYKPDPLPLWAHRKAKVSDGIVWPEWSPEAKKEKKEVDRGLTHGEREDLAEIKAMAKTNIDLAKSMATEWLTRIGISRETAARRRSWLKTVKGLHSHRRGQ